MTDQPIDPATIRVGQLAKFTCPSCGFSFTHTWLPLDGGVFGESFCYMHDPKVVMVITEVLPPLEAV